MILSETGEYHIDIPLDSMVHWSWELSCTRATDDACVPCNQIRSAQGVMIKSNFGPCIVFTEDHRSFTVPVSPGNGPGLSPFTPINPANALSGIECGTA